MIDASNSKKVLSKGDKLNIAIKKLQEKGLKNILISNEEIVENIYLKILKIKVAKLLLAQDLILPRNN